MSAILEGFSVVSHEGFISQFQVQEPHRLSTIFTIGIAVKVLHAVGIIVDAKIVFLVLVAKPDGGKVL
jgi:hypothetical protein